MSESTTPLPNLHLPVELWWSEPAWQQVFADDSQLCVLGVSFRCLNLIFSPCRVHSSQTGESINPDELPKESGEIVRAGNISSGSQSYNVNQCCNDVLSLRESLNSAAEVAAAAACWLNMQPTPGANAINSEPMGYLHVSAMFLLKTKGFPNGRRAALWKRKKITAVLLQSFWLKRIFFCSFFFGL